MLKLYYFAVIPRVGGCGLKLTWLRGTPTIKCHPPCRGMWIEIPSAVGGVVVVTERHPPCRGMWIEIVMQGWLGDTKKVIPRVGGCGLK